MNRRAFFAALLAAPAAVLLGKSKPATPQPLFHRDAFYLETSPAPIEYAEGWLHENRYDWYVDRNWSRINMKRANELQREYNISQLARLDVLYGFDVLQPETSCKILEEK